MAKKMMAKRVTAKKMEAKRVGAKRVGAKKTTEVVSDRIKIQGNISLAGEIDVQNITFHNDRWSIYMDGKENLMARYKAYDGTTTSYLIAAAPDFLKRKARKA